MATAKTILNTKYESKDKKYPIVIRLIHGKKQKLHPTGERVDEKFWDSEQVSKKHPESKRINSVIDAELSKAKRYFADCRINNLPIDLNLVYCDIKSYNFTDYLRHKKNQHDQKRQVVMRRKVGRYIIEFTECFGRDIYFSEINQDLLSQYEVFLMNQKNCSNTRYKKFEFLGKYYNNAINDGKAIPVNPFKIYKSTIKQEPVKKDKLTFDQLLAIENLPLKEGPVKFARDIFLFSYYCKGIRFETCITMKKSAIQDKRLLFQINKGKHHLSAEIHPMLKGIIDTYSNNDTDTIFGRFNSDDILDEEKRISKLGSENTMINNNLKEVASLAGIPLELSMHHSRHSFAFHLKHITESIHVIKDSLGHSGTHVTEKYLKDLDDTYLDSKIRPLYDRVSG